jgi:hypothetical protein
MPEFVIHIGPHKTGTTYLQLHFRAMRASLEERGIIFPEFWQLAPGNPSQLPLMQQLRDGEADLLRPRFAELLGSGADRILLSAEDLSNLEVPALQLLHTLIGGNAVKIVFYLRRWSELVPSSWQEGMKHGQFRSLPEFILSHIQQPQISRLLNFEHKVSRFAEVFGADSIKLVSYSELRDRHIDLFKHFAASFLDWPDAHVRQKITSPNSSRAPEYAELLRAVNAMTAQRGGTPDGALRRRLDMNRRELDLEPLFAAMRNHQRTVHFNDSGAALRDLHRTLMLAHIAKVVEPKRNKLLFRPRSASLAYIDGDYQLEPGVVPALAGVVDRLCAIEKEERPGALPLDQAGDKSPAPDSVGSAFDIDTEPDDPAV